MMIYITRQCLVQTSYAYYIAYILKVDLQILQIILDFPKKIGWERKNLSLFTIFFLSKMSLTDEHWRDGAGSRKFKLDSWFFLLQISWRRSPLSSCSTPFYLPLYTSSPYWIGAWKALLLYEPKLQFASHADDDDRFYFKVCSWRKIHSYISQFLLLGKRRNSSIYQHVTGFNASHHGQ